MPATLTRQKPAPKRFVHAPSSVEPGKGNFVKQSGPLKVIKRRCAGRVVYDFVEKPADGSTKLDEPLIYSYAVGTGELTVSSASFWSKQNLLSDSAAAQKIGARSAIPGDPEAALRVARAHYDQYTPPTDPALAQTRKQKLLNGTN